MQSVYDLMNPNDPVSVCCLILLQAYVDVSHQALVGIKLFDWDRTGDHDALGR